MTTTILIILGLVLLVVFARSVAREAKRITIEAGFRIDGLSSLIESLNGDDKAAEKLERKSARFKARAEEVASRQTPIWKAVSKAVRKHRS